VGTTLSHPLKIPLPTINVVYDRYESSVKDVPSLEWRKPVNGVSRIKE